ncbi:MULTISPECIES: sulfite exporter TauE/SafE family protein [Pseudoxanthomonas]|uniref:Probable membrane transporter protein n=1 Tax=Pseudoxanthomonas winnipegensis TaxID=2480810 RepID=A0AAW8GEU2_9GAMM|nr:MULTISPECIES: sulfite exporter TauE/SafE family protein [Pseudoxanthomonas]MDQ1121026.1 putative membrane protein YfcA [Pseudoxanthomonas winnipegensis]MDQ1134257.1 putative membrane protein YfcA [Pseudoxanthomonas winnipegensis]MDR6139510.1 putative membrane protein YfcA [Pseudoxanthomonas sp. SORGH_AS_0997]
MQISTEVWWLIVLGTFFVAGCVKGVTGMGLPTVAMGVLGALMSPAWAAALLLLPSLVTNVLQLVSGGQLGALLRRLWPMQLAVVAGTLLASAWLADGAAQGTARLLGIALVLYALVTLLSRPFRVSPALERVLAPLVGGITGVVTGVTGVFVIPAVPFLQALGLQRDALVQALGLSFTVSTLALAAGLALHGALSVGHLLPSSIAVLPALAGMWLGQRLRQRIRPAAFRTGFLICLLLLGVELAWRG